MTKRVLKYALKADDGPQPLRLSEGAEVVHVAGQRGAVCLWALEPKSVKVMRYFQLVGTGWEIDLPLAGYVGTAHVGDFVWHVFEVPEPERDGV